MNQVTGALATAMKCPHRSELPALSQQPRLLDSQNWSVLLAGALLLDILLTTNYSDDNLSPLGVRLTYGQVGMDPHLATLAALAGVDKVFSEVVAQLATRL